MSAVKGKGAKGGKGGAKGAKGGKKGGEVPTKEEPHQLAIKSADEPPAIFVGGLPQSCQEEHLYEFAEQYGEIVKATVKIDPTTCRSRGFGFIQFKDAASSQELMGVAVHEIHGKKIEVKVGDPKAKSSQRKASWGGDSYADYGGYKRPQEWAPRQPENGPFLGKIINVSEHGAGYIDCPVCKNWYSKDVYIFPQVLEDNGLEAGNAMGFYVHENSRGLPCLDTNKPVWKLMMEPKDKMPQLGQYQGNVCAVTERGHAYVKCYEAKRMYGKDVYINAKVVENNGIVEGQHVCFNIHVNVAGEPQASSPLWIQTNADPVEPREEGDAKRQKTEEVNVEF